MAASAAFILLSLKATMFSSAAGELSCLTISNYPAAKGAVIVMIRHGKTDHNKLSLFTGWEDYLAVKVWKKANSGQDAEKTVVDIVYVVVVACDRDVMARSGWLGLGYRLSKSWRLSERHYVSTPFCSLSCKIMHSQTNCVTHAPSDGRFDGKSKAMIARQFGEVNSSSASWLQGQATCITLSLPNTRKR
jgi:hypothetical protein